LRQIWYWNTFALCRPRCGETIANLWAPKVCLDWETSGVCEEAWGFRSGRGFLCGRGLVQRASETPVNAQNGGTFLAIVNLMADSESGSPDSYSSLLVTICLSHLVSEVFTCDGQTDRQTDNADHYYSWPPHFGGPANNAICVFGYLSVNQPAQCICAIYCRCVPSRQSVTISSNGAVMSNGCVCHEKSPALSKSRSTGLTPDTVDCHLCTQLHTNHYNSGHIDTKVWLHSGVSDNWVIVGLSSSLLCLLVILSISRSMSQNISIASLAVAQWRWRWNIEWIWTEIKILTSGRPA